MMDERLLRTGWLLGPEALERLARARVLVFGLGAVGAACTEHLARAGVRRFRLVDFDVVTASSLNRLVTGTAATVGWPKVQAAADRLRAIEPDLDIEERREFLGKETLVDLLARDVDGCPTVVVDAIDSLTPKLDLLAACLAGGLAVVSSMGAGGRRDPSLVRTLDLWSTSTCPLALRVRKGLRRRGLERPLTVVCSEESPVGPVERQADAQGEHDAYFARGRLRGAQPTVAWVPAAFAAQLAAAAANHLLADAGQ